MDNQETGDHLHVFGPLARDLVGFSRKFGWTNGGTDDFPYLLVPFTFREGF